MSSVNTIREEQDSSDRTTEFFNRYFTGRISYPSNQVNAVIGFFESRGFEKASAAAVASVLLQQAKIDNVNVFELLDSLKGFDKLKLSALVAVILNSNRSKISKIGFREEIETDLIEARNIIV